MRIKRKRQLSQLPWWQVGAFFIAGFLCVLLYMVFFGQSQKILKITSSTGLATINSTAKSTKETAPISLKKAVSVAKKKVIKKVVPSSVATSSPATTTPISIIIQTSSSPTTTIIAATTTAAAPALSTTATTTTATSTVFIPPLATRGSALPSPFFSSVTPPPVLTIAECSSSLNPNFCLINTTTATLSWTAVQNATKYGVWVNGAESTTTIGITKVLTLADQATTTLAVVAYDPGGRTLTSASQDVRVAVPPPSISSVSDTFDTFNSAGWQTFGSNVKNFDVDDNPSVNCFHSGCVVGSAANAFTALIPRMYLESPPALSAGAFTVYAKSRSGFNSPNPTISICQAPSLGCTNGNAINFLNQIPSDNTWHQYYFAWRQGPSFVQSCILQDVTDPSHCSWTDTSFALGTQFDGVGLWSGNGYRADLGANLWFDELQAR